jgi:hypothetical protein
METVEPKALRMARRISVSANRLLDFFMVFPEGIHQSVRKCIDFCLFLNPRDSLKPS